MAQKELFGKGEYESKEGLLTKEDPFAKEGVLGKEGTTEAVGGKETNTTTRIDLEDPDRDESISDKEEVYKRPVHPRFSLLWFRDKIWLNKYFALFVWFFAFAFFLLGVLVWKDFTWQAWYSIITVFLTFCLLIKNVWEADVIMLLSTTVLLLPAIITPAEAIAGFASTGVFTIAVLFVVAEGVANTGALHWVAQRLLPKTGKSLRMALLRMSVPLTATSAFTNNTPLMAIMIPIIERWCQKTGVPPSKMMIPTSYSTILGGVCTIIGTSTNLIVVALVKIRDPSLSFPFFEVGYVGVPIAIVGVIYIVLLAPWLLPKRRSPIQDILDHPKQYALSVQVEKNSPVVNKSIEEAGLRHLNGIYLVEILRNGETYSSASDFYLLENDVLVFAGDVNNVKDLFLVKGLKATNHEEEVVKPSSKKILVEAVVSPRGHLNGKTVREANFREKYGAVIISIAREGTPLRTKLGEVELAGGDSLLLVCKPSKVEKLSGQSDFITVSEVGGGPMKRDLKMMILAPLIAILMMALSAAEVTDLLTASLAAAFLMIFLGIISISQAVQASRIRLIVVIAASFGMATALEVTGVANELANNMLAIFGGLGGYGLLYGVYIATVLLTALLSNASSAALMIPIVFGLSASGQTDVGIKAFIYCIMVAASADFSTPIGYQTNLMAWGPGGYKFTDYAIVGVPLQFILSILTVSLLYLFFGSSGEAEDEGGAAAAES